MTKKWYRFDFWPGPTQFITQILADRQEEALRVLESAHPEVRNVSMLGIVGPSDKPEDLEIIGRQASSSQPQVEYINTL